jgi:hypothetical protein
MASVESHRQDKDETANAGGLLLVTAALVGTVSTWPWSMISAAIGAAALLILVHVNFLRPWRRRKKLKNPAIAHFVIPSNKHHGCDFAVQNEQEHLVKTIVVPAQGEILIDLRIQPRMAFVTSEISIGCEGEVTETPFATEYLNRFIETGEGKHIIPGNGNRHYIDKYHFYHCRESQRQWSRGFVLSLAFKLKTRKSGRYVLDIYFVGDEVEGKDQLTIIVEDKPKTVIRCVERKHKRMQCRKAIQPISHDAAAASSSSADDSGTALMR